MAQHIFTLRPVDIGGDVTITITDDQAQQSMRWAEVRDRLALHYADRSLAPFGITFGGSVIGEPAYARVVAYEQRD